MVVVDHCVCSTSTELGSSFFYICMVWTPLFHPSSKDSRGGGSGCMLYRRETGDALGRFLYRLRTWAVCREGKLKFLFLSCGVDTAFLGLWPKVSDIPLHRHGMGVGWRGRRADKVRGEGKKEKKANKKQRFKYVRFLREGNHFMTPTDTLKKVYKWQVTSHPAKFKLNTHGEHLSEFHCMALIS